MVAIVLQYADWRMVFFVGILPALVVLWIQKGVAESEMWVTHQRSSQPQTIDSAQNRDIDGFVRVFQTPLLKPTLTLLLLNFFGLFAWWGLFTWIPPYLSLPVDQGGRGFGLMGTTTLLVVLNLVGMFPGYSTFGWVADQLGRRKAFILYTVAAAAFVPLYAVARNPVALLVLGAVVAFFGTGFFSGSGIVGSEIFPTRVRARALGFTYNGARAMSSVAPFVIGRVGQSKGLGWAFYLCAGSFLLAALMATQLPETRGKHLE